MCERIRAWKCMRIQIEIGCFCMTLLSQYLYRKYGPIVQYYDIVHQIITLLLCSVCLLTWVGRSSPTNSSLLLFHVPTKRLLIQEHRNIVSARIKQNLITLWTEYQMGRMKKTSNLRKRLLSSVEVMRAHLAGLLILWIWSFQWKLGYARW